ncbi:MAG: hypothetical protein AAFO04_11520 [Cyanobacteria bacterium J06592_8]
MLHTYNALLKDNQIEWIDEVPTVSDRPVRVHVTFLEDPSTSATASQGQRMAEILAKIADLNPFADIDPKALQREIRQDRPLPYRE